MNNLKPKTMSEAKEAIIDFLTDQLAVNTEQLREYSSDNLLPPSTPDGVRQMREQEAIKLRDRINFISTIQSFINNLFPKENDSKGNKE